MFLCMVEGIYQVFLILDRVIVEQYYANCRVISAYMQINIRNDKGKK